MEAFERELPRYEQVRDGIRVGVVLQRLEESTLKQRMLINSERLTKSADFQAEVIKHR